VHELRLNTNAAKGISIFFMARICIKKLKLN
jgi:hypothetical protein